ncbi:MAG: DNA polymerase III subunit alpha, partial [Pseudomonadota bacterium]
MSSASFIHLRTHSAYSLLEGALPLKKLINWAKDNDAPAIAITDSNNLFGALEFAVKASGDGIQPIIGCQVSFDFGEANDTNASKPIKRAAAPVLLIAADETGYSNLVELVSQAYLSPGETGETLVEVDWLSGKTDGIICLTGGPDGPIGLAMADGNLSLAQKRLEKLQSYFGNRLYVELQRHGAYNKRLELETVKLAHELALPLVATNDAHFLKKEDYQAHDALIAIADGEVLSNDDRRQLTSDHWLKPAEDMVALYADIPEAVENTVEIARRCSYFPITRKPILPRFAKVPDGATVEEADQAESDELKRHAREGLAARLEINGLADGHSREDYEARLEHELSIIENMKFPGYFLIVADFIKWAKEQDIPVGPGRGSGAGSLVAWSLTITDIDPLRFSLLFERFLNPARVSMPDFDIDFCQERRGEVIRYVQEKYGTDQVGQIITFGTLQARAVLRDVGRVLEMPYGQVDRLCKLVPNNPA